MHPARGTGRRARTDERLADAVRTLLTDSGYAALLGIPFGGVHLQGRVDGEGMVADLTRDLLAILRANVDAVTGSNPAAAVQAGASQVLDYLSVRPSAVTDRYDAILDAVGADSSAYRALLVPGGRMVLITTAGPAAARAHRDAEERSAAGKRVIVVQG